MSWASLLWAGAGFLGTGLAAIFFSGTLLSSPACGLAHQFEAARRFRAAGLVFCFSGCAALLVHALLERHPILAAAAFFAALLIYLGCLRPNSGRNAGGRENAVARASEISAESRSECPSKGCGTGGAA